MIRGSADVRALLPLYRSGTLPRARYLLVEDHLQECVACRHAADFQADAAPEWRTAMSALARWNPVRFDAFADMAILVVASVFSYRLYQAGPAGPRAEVQSVQGVLYRISINGMQVIEA